MDNEKVDIFVVLLKLKSFLLSLVEDGGNYRPTFELTNEFLERKYPALKNDILELLLKNGIKTDGDIAFNEKIHFKFREMVKENEQKVSLDNMLDSLDIESAEIDIYLEKLHDFQGKRDKDLQIVIESLMKLVRNWVEHKEIESKVDHYSTLDEEEVIRPFEEEKLNELGHATELSYKKISNSTKRYIELFALYYFNYGGNITLEKFLADLDTVTELIKEKYKDLYNNHGLSGDKFDN